MKSFFAVSGYDKKINLIKTSLLTLFYALFTFIGGYIYVAILFSAYVFSIKAIFGGVVFLALLVLIVSVITIPLIPKAKYLLISMPVQAAVYTAVYFVTPAKPLYAASAVFVDPLFAALLSLDTTSGAALTVTVYTLGAFICQGIAYGIKALAVFLRKRKAPKVTNESLKVRRLENRMDFTELQKTLTSGGFDIRYAVFGGDGAGEYELIAEYREKLRIAISYDGGQLNTYMLYGNALSLKRVPLRYAVDFVNKTHTPGEWSFENIKVLADYLLTNTAALDLLCEAETQKEIRAAWKG